MSEFESLSLDPGVSLQFIVVQELVAQNVGALVLGDELSASGSSISEGVWARRVLGCVKEFQNDSSSLPLRLLGDVDEDRFVVISHVDESLGVSVPEE
jgi:hypothetical protein